MADLSPTRSRTDPPAPERTQLPNIARRLRAESTRSKGQFGGSHKHSHHHRSTRQHAKDTVQSAVELKPPITFDHLLRRDRKSPDSSRRESATAVQPQLDGVREEKSEMRVRPEDIDKAKKENTRREEELRANLKSVEEVSMSSTRQLDETYYAILDKASLLRSTVSSLQQLADESRRMHAAFREDTAKLEKDTQQSVQGFESFEPQEKTINGLVDQLQSSRQNTDTLNHRLESARLRVEAFEKRENAKQTRRKMRWRMIWAAFAGVLILIISIVLARNRRKVGLQLDAVGQQLVRIGDAVEDIAAPLSSRIRGPAPTIDPYLERLFDDL